MSVNPAGQDASWPENSILGRLRVTQRQELLNTGTFVRYLPDKEVMTQDSKDTHVLLLLSGAVKIMAGSEGGHSALLAVRVAGDLVGEMAALDQKPRSATVVTCGDVSAKMISSAELTAFLHRRPDAFMMLAGMINDRLRWSNQRRQDFVSFNATERVARVLAELVQTYGRKGPAGWVLGIPLTNVELASIAGMKPRTADKAFGELRRADVVRSHRHRDFIVPDLEKLNDFCRS
jgi:CRP-like cAMP-binding protein